MPIRVEVSTLMGEGPFIEWFRAKHTMPNGVMRLRRSV